MAQVFSIDWIDERPWIGAGKGHSVLTDDVPMNHPVALVRLGDKLITEALDVGWQLSSGSKRRSA